MKLVSYHSSRGPRAGRLDGDQILDLNEADASLPASVRELLALGSDGLKRAAAAKGKTQPLGEVKLLAPIVDPPKILCVGANYADHAAESGMAIPTEPIIFSKLSTTLCGPNDVVRLPRVAHKVDYEAELVVIIGKTGKNIPLARAMEHVAGYACGHDVSARDWQKGKPGGQWTLGKGFDTFGPLGPFLATPDEVGDPNNLRVQLRLNGQTMQDSNTSQFIFKIDFLIEYISACVTLQPGDLLYTGTPPGVGFARNPPVWLKPGDVTEVEIEKLGVLRNSFASE
jgi:2-keto-4-pentenoate hydratase/2-oxohepta-3-ene-1,7-dioic acid hydratase in catechol pathway